MSGWMNEGRKVVRKIFSKCRESAMDPWRSNYSTSLNVISQSILTQTVTAWKKFPGKQANLRRKKRKKEERKVKLKSLQAWQGLN